MMAAVFVMLAMPAAGLVTPVQQKPFTGCKKVSLLHRGDPADSKTIDGDDCGNVKQIIGKWAKSKKVGELAGAAKAAVMGADLAATNTDDAVERAKALGKKVGLDDKMPPSVKLAAEEADKASKAATKAGATLKTTADTFKGKFDDFAKAISGDDISKIKEETQAAIDAADDAKEAAERALDKADEAKDKAMKSVDGALALIKATLTAATKLSEDAKVAGQKSTQATKSVGDLLKKSTAADGKIDKKIADAKEQAPVWKAYKSDLKGRHDAADTSSKDVTKAVDALDSARGDMDIKAKALQSVKDAGESAPNVLLGQSKNIGDAEEEIRKTETAFSDLKSKVQTMMKDSARLSDKIDDTNKRLKD